MDSPVLNSFIADDFLIRSPTSRDVNFNDNRLRRLTSSKSENLREAADRVAGGQLFTNFETTEPVHPGFENVRRDGLRMHPVQTRRASAADVAAPSRENIFLDGLPMHPVSARRHSYDGFEIPGGEWDVFDSIGDEFAASNADFEFLIAKPVKVWRITLSSDGLRSVLSKQDEIGGLSVRGCTRPAVKWVGWLKGRLAKIK